MAAGLGTRLRPITNHVPKPMIRVGGKHLIQHNIEKLPEEIDELIFVVNYLKEQIQNHFGPEYLGRKITYIDQKEKLGTGHALLMCKHILKNKFIVINGDDIYSRKDMQKVIQNDNCMLVKEVYGKFNGGKIIFDENGNLLDIIEGEHQQGNSHVNTGFYALTKNFFDYDLVPIKNGAEYGLPQTMIQMSKDYPVKVEKANYWLQINTLADLEKAEKILS